MAAHVQKRVHLATVVTHHQNRVFAHIGGEEIAGLRDLAVVAQKQPATGENAFQFLLINIGLDKDAAADQSALSVDETGDIRCHIILPSHFQ
jgi:hypothetical protein